MPVQLSLDTPGTIEFDDGGICTKRTLLESGIRVLTQRVPGQRSVALAFWVGVGSRDEAPGEEGSTHFLEHLLFKGTRTRTAAEISELSDFLGGNMNAATARQYTSYYGRVFASDLPQLLELLIDMFCNSRLDLADMNIERTVILEELAASDDDITEVAEDAALRLLFGDHPLARPVGGTAQSVSALDNEELRSHYQRHYKAPELVVSAAGDLDHEELVMLLQRLLRNAGWDLGPAAPAPRRKLDPIQYGGGRDFISRPGRSSAVVVGYPGLVFDDRPATMIALETILGGGQSSRLFQEVRELRGLAYSTYAWQAAFAEGGIAAMTAMCAPNNVDLTIEVMTDCARAIAERGLGATEVESAFRQRRSRLVFALENNAVRTQRLASAELLTGTYFPTDELLERARAVEGDQIQALAQQIISRPPAIIVCGPEH